MATLLEIPEELMNMLLKGDSRCKYQIGERVVKVCLDVGDILPIGHLGTIKGCCHLAPAGDLYLVLYDGQESTMLAAPWRFKKCD